MLSTRYVPGSVCWLDLGSPDISATAAYYQGLFGWSHKATGDYGAFQVDGKTVAGLGPLTEEGARPAWMLYFQTPDADATLKAVEQAGGTSRTPVIDAGDTGRFAQLTDPDGAEFAIWQPDTSSGTGTHTHSGTSTGADSGTSTSSGADSGLELVNEPGSLGWTELYTADPRAGEAFYQAVFGWRVEVMPMGELSYPVISPAEGEGAAMGGIVQLQPGDRPHWLPYFEVADCDQVVATSRATGGAVLAPVTEVEDVGRFAFLADPHGARFAVITSAT